jgi:hypothetical protein
MTCLDDVQCSRVRGVVYDPYDLCVDPPGESNAGRGGRARDARTFHGGPRFKQQQQQQQQQLGHHKNNPGAVVRTVARLRWLEAED